SGSGDEAALIQALREARGSTVASTPTPSGATSEKAKAKGGKNSAKAKRKGSEKVVAHTSNGTVHQIAGFTPSKKKEEADTKLVKKTPNRVASTYVKAQQNPPDVPVVGGNPEEAPPLPTGKGQP